MSSDQMCPSVSVASADATRDRGNWVSSPGGRVHRSVSRRPMRPRYRVSWSGGASPRVHRSVSRRPMRRKPAGRRRCSRSSVHRSVSRRPMRLEEQGYGWLQLHGVHRSVSRRPMRQLIISRALERHECPSVSVASADATWTAWPDSTPCCRCPSVSVASADATAVTGDSSRTWTVSIGQCRVGRCDGIAHRLAASGANVSIGQCRVGRCDSFSAISLGFRSLCPSVSVASADATV